MNHLWILLLSLIALAITVYLLNSKIHNRQVICPIHKMKDTGNSCNDVITSKYGRLFGFPNEVLGILFYIGMIGYSISLFFLTWPFLVFVLVIIGAGLAGVMSLILTLIQVFKLKHICEWCMATNVINWAIFIFVFL